MKNTALRLVTLGGIELQGGSDAADLLQKRPRKLAVLAVLALSARPAPRATLVEMFWGHQEERRARHSLSDALSHLRRLLGADAIATHKSSLSLAPGAPLSVDAVEFMDAAARGDAEGALALWRGQFLEGFGVPDSRSFEEWLDRERRRLAAAFAGVCHRECARLADGEQWFDAAALARRWMDVSPTDARAHRFIERAHAVLADGLPPARAGAVPKEPDPAQLALWARWQRARAGRRQLVVVTGGRDAASRLAAQTAERASAEGATTLAVRCFARERDIKYGVIAQLISEMSDAPGLAATGGAQLAELTRLSPGLAARFPGLEAARGTDTGASMRMVAAVAAALENIAYEAPVFLRIEDAQWIDRPSFTALQFLVRTMAGAPVCLVLTEDSEAADERSGPVAPLASRLFDSVPPEDAELLAVPQGPRVHATAARPHAWRRIGAIAAGLLVITASGVLATRRASARPTVLVGSITHQLGPDSGMAHVLPGLLTSGLSRLEGLRVLGRVGVYERLGGNSDDPLALTRIARASGATEMIEGTVYREGQRLRLELRRLAVSNDAVRAVVFVEADDVFALVESATRDLARAYGVPQPRLDLSSVTSPSVLAQHLYQQGLRAHYWQGDDAAARTLYRSALHEDSSFAAAAHQLAGLTGQPLDWSRADRLAQRATDDERLQIRYDAARARGSPEAKAIAESLAASFPEDIRTAMALGHALRLSGDFLGSITQFERVVAADSAVAAMSMRRCFACEAMYHVSESAMLADSMALAVRALLRLRGTTHSAYANELAGTIYARWGKSDSARSLYARAGMTTPFDSSSLSLETMIREHRLLSAEAWLRQRLGGGGGRDSRGEEVELRGMLALVLRLQGRFAESRAEGVRYRALSDASGQGHFASRLPLALGWLHAANDSTPAGRSAGRAAAAQFDSMTSMWELPDDWDGIRARHHSWMLTHVSTALWRAGDTARLPRLADSIATIGRRSGYGRDQQLHWYVRGLLHMSRGDTARAADYLERARYSAVETYLAVPLARAQLALRRPADALYTVEAALRGPLDSQNQYESRTELLALRERLR